MVCARGTYVLAWTSVPRSMGLGMATAGTLCTHATRGRRGQRWGHGPVPLLVSGRDAATRLLATAWPGPGGARLGQRSPVGRLHLPARWPTAAQDCGGQGAKRWNAGEQALAGDMGRCRCPCWMVEGGRAGARALSSMAARPPPSPSQACLPHAGQARLPSLTRPRPAPGARARAVLHKQVAVVAKVKRVAALVQKAVGGLPQELLEGRCTVVDRLAWGQIGRRA